MKEREEVINTLVCECHNAMLKQGFWEPTNPECSIGSKLMLIVTEMGEFYEKYRKDDLTPDEHCPGFSNQTIEIADLFLRLFDLTGGLGIKYLGEAIIAKKNYNETRPYKHGKRF